MKKIILFLVFFAIPFISYGQFQTLPPPWDTSMVVHVDDHGDTLTVNGKIGVTGTFWQTTQPVSGTFWQATQPISGTVAISQTTTANDVDVATIAAGDNNIGNVDVVTMPTVTVNAHAVTNAGTFVVQENGSALTALQLIDNAISGAGVNVTQFAGATVPIGAGTEATAVRVTLPTDGTGLVTAKQSTAANLNMTEASASAIKTAVELIDNCISGNEAQVDVLTMPTVTVNTHAVTVASGGIASGAIASGAVSSGAIASGSIVAGAVVAGAASFVKLEDVGSADADAGVPSIAVRKATPANTSGTDGDYEFLQMSAGRLWTSATIDAALPAGTAAIGKLASNTGVDIGDVDVTSIVPGTAATNLGKAEDVGHTTADAGVMALGVANTANADISGTTLDYTPIATDLTGAVHVMGKSAIDAAIPVNPIVVGGRASTATPTAMSTDGDLQAQWLTLNGAAVVDGGIAHDATDAGSPVKFGAKAETSPKGITVVADGDRTDLYADADGMQMVKLNTSGADLLSERTTNTDGASTASAVFTAVASTYNYVTAISVYNSSATAGYIDFRDGTAGTIKWTMPLPAGGGAVLSSAVPLFKTSANTALAYDVSAALSTIYISVSGYQGKL